MGIPSYIIIYAVLALFVVAVVVCAYGETIMRARFRRRYGRDHRIYVNVTEKNEG